jgi:hypothetical protein
MDGQIGSQGEGVRNRQQAVFGVRRGDFDDVELLDGRAVMIAEVLVRSGLQVSPHPVPKGAQGWRSAAAATHLYKLHNAFDHRQLWEGRTARGLHIVAVVPHIDVQRPIVIPPDLWYS